jgi:hypothetical protein
MEPLVFDTILPRGEGAYLDEVVSPAGPVCPISNWRFAAGLRPTEVTRGIARPRWVPVGRCKGRGCDRARPQCTS